MDITRSDIEGIVDFLAANPEGATDLEREALAAYQANPEAAIERALAPAQPAAAVETSVMFSPDQLRHAGARSLTAQTTQPGLTTTDHIDWTLVVNFDNHGTLWGVDSVENTDDMIDRERANGLTIHEWSVADRAGLPIRIVRIADPEFLDTICVFPAECPDCCAPVTSSEWVSDEHHAKCPRRDPHF